MNKTKIDYHTVYVFGKILTAFQILFLDFSFNTSFTILWLRISIIFIVDIFLFKISEIVFDIKKPTEIEATNLKKANKIKDRLIISVTIIYAVMHMFKGYLFFNPENIINYCISFTFLAEIILVSLLNKNQPSSN
ncbi:TPA: hypothetical protein ACG3P3_001627 [Clostridioides difficile]